MGICFSANCACVYCHTASGGQSTAFTSIGDSGQCVWPVSVGTGLATVYTLIKMCTVCMQYTRL